MSKDKKIYDFETTPGLPLKYNRLFFALMVRDPWWGYTCWEIPDDVMAAHREKLSDQAWKNSKFILRMAELSNSDSFALAPSFDIVLPEDFKIASWHINFPGKESIFQGALGRLTEDNEFIPIIFSNVVSVPDPEMSDVVDNTWNLNFGDYETFLSQELERIRNVSTQKHSTSRDLNIEKDRFYRQKVLRGYVESNFSSDSLVKPGIGMCQLTEEDYARLGEGKGLSSQQIPHLPVGSSETLMHTGSSEIQLRPGSSEQVVPGGGSEQLVRLGSSEGIVRPDMSSEKEEFLKPGSSEVFVKSALSIESEELLRPGSSEQIVLRPGSSEAMVKPETSEVPIIPVSVKQVHKLGSSEQKVLRPGSSEQIVLRPGSSEAMVKPETPEVPIIPVSVKQVHKLGSSEQKVLRPGSSEQIVLRPGSSEIQLRPGSSEQMVLRPGSSEQIIRTGSSEAMIRPGSSEAMIRPGSSESLLHLGSSNSPIPELYDEPEESHWIACSYEITIYGNTSPGSVLTFEGDEIPVSRDGRFSVRLAMPSQAQEIEFLSTNPEGETRVIRTMISRNEQKVEI